MLQASPPPPQPTHPKVETCGQNFQTPRWLLMFHAVELSIAVSLWSAITLVCGTIAELDNSDPCL